MFPLRDTASSRRVPIATLSLIIINTVIFLNQLIMPPDEALKMVLTYSFIPARLLAGWKDPMSYIPLFTSMFLHGNFSHLISNMWSLWLFGDNVEDYMGPIRFLIFYVLTGLIAGIAHFAFNPLLTVPTVGASGAIAGVMGAYFMMFPFARIITLIPFFPFIIRVPASIFLLIWFITQVNSGIMSGISGNVIGGVAWWAHIFGFIAGALLYKKFVRKKKYVYYY
ncbi:rhomboid family intramembrane serine protease [Tepidanaerobacter syntrophicus]|uniref:Membrane associated serine protease, rhomboid family n=2 Tax=Tepidanaerobacteraceae TaxID=2770092 RepID=A0A0U9HJE5_9FIRM|nr:rhomboid family intramembrane serine protease [Tepidanaerobacter syntrophicus]GAQ25468.1 membrane associated serine protease, rhomboid family [Tepidanaerobacter syntrophicus]GLI19984.1 rhomboid family intramembrane serine protease [Tepidanaerobacter syntrophicus]